MATEPKKVTVQANRVDASILPDSFSLSYRLYVIQQGSDLKNLADSSNNANDLAYQATVKNDEQDLTLSDHESRISALRVDVNGHEIRITNNTNAIAALDVRLTNAEGSISTLTVNLSNLTGRVTTAEGNISSLTTRVSTAESTLATINGAYVSKTVTAPQTLASPINVATSYSVNGTQVVSTRKTGWTASTGNAYRGAFNANAIQSVSPTYSQTEVNGIMSLLLEARQRIKALEDDMRSHGLIN